MKQVRTTDRRRRALSSDPVPSQVRAGRQKRVAPKAKFAGVYRFTKRG